MLSDQGESAGERKEREAVWNYKRSQAQGSSGRQLILQITGKPVKSGPVRTIT